MSVRRIFVEKKPDYAVKAGELREELVSYLGITGVKSVRVLIRYDIENLSESTIEKFINLGWLNSIKDIYYLSDHENEMKSIGGRISKEPGRSGIFRRVPAGTV